jgi:hypothetical protein
MPKKRGYDKEYYDNHKEQITEYQKKWRSDNKERVRRYKANQHLKSTYGITLDDYDQMFEDQDNGCAICGGLNTDGRRLHVDHNHETGEVRGLLCYSCNINLGWFENNLEDVISYLEKYSNA